MVFLDFFSIYADYYFVDIVSNFILSLSPSVKSILQFWNPDTDLHQHLIGLCSKYNRYTKFHANASITLYVVLLTQRQVDRPTDRPIGVKP